MQLSLRDDLPWATLTISYRGNHGKITDVLVDTGSSTTLLAADAAAQIGINPAPEDKLVVIRGVGGQEVVFARVVDEIGFEGKQLADFEIEVGGMDYGFTINGILGMDFLRATRAVIDIGRMEIVFE